MLDSIDLQDQNAPSAKDHTRQPAHPAPLGAGPPAPHQAEALRDAAIDDQHPRSPRVSKDWSNGEGQFDQFGGDALGTDSLTGANLQQQDQLAVAQNGGLTGSTAEDAEMADAEGEDSMDDDMMDKISSSPSIDDGGYSLPQLWPQRFSSKMRANILERSSPVSQACGESSSSFVDPHNHYPLQPQHDEVIENVVLAEQVLEHHHLPGEYLDNYDIDDASNYELAQSDTTISPSRTQSGEHWENYEQYYDLDDYIDNHLAGETEAMSVDVNLTGGVEMQNLDFDDEGMTVPYVASEDEEEDDDDSYEFPEFPNERFTDSGWGGECLQELEDIDFEFVYALHTFVATVEGQANATKGDTMVLLDDSNSYWWLVRVVKDSSIGK